VPADPVSHKHPPAVGAGSVNALLSQDLKVCQTLTHSLAEDGYVPLKVANLGGGPKAPCPLYLKIARPQGRIDFLPCCAAGEVFLPEWAVQLSQKGVDRLYFRGEHQPRVLGFLHSGLRRIMRDPHLTPQDKAARVTDVTLMWTRHFYRERRVQVSSQLLMAWEYLDCLFSCLEEDSSYAGWVLELCSFDGMLYTHCLNTSLIGLAYAHFLRWPRPAVCSFGLGALLHDIGIARLAPANLQAARPASGGEVPLLRQHPLVGYDLLKTFTSLGPEALLMVLQHHENCDGSGYPQGLRHPAIAPESRVMRLIDAFEALTFGRIRGEALTPVQALWLMRRQWETDRIYDTEYLTAFIKFFSG
jgi:HD-GYP domain-containing protein (c-di-GMP phosphodiesterase class II)